MIKTFRFQIIGEPGPREIKAHDAGVHESGALVFTDGDTVPIITFGPTVWFSVALVREATAQASSVTPQQ